MLVSEAAGCSREPVKGRSMGVKACFGVSGPREQLNASGFPLQLGAQEAAEGTFLEQPGARSG